MDGYISKPLRPTELFEAVEALAGDTAEPSSEPASVSPVSDNAVIFDQDAALHSTGGSMEVLRDIAELFLQEYPVWLEQLQQSIATSNADVLRRTAHSVKGSSSYFGTEAIQHLAQKLETMGREQSMADAEEVFAELKRLLELLAPALENFLAESSPVPQ